MYILYFRRIGDTDDPVLEWWTQGFLNVHIHVLWSQGFLNVQIHVLWSQGFLNVQIHVLWSLS